MHLISVEERENDVPGLYTEKNIIDADVDEASEKDTDLSFKTVPKVTDIKLNTTGSNDAEDLESATQNLERNQETTDGKQTTSISRTTKMRIKGNDYALTVTISPTIKADTDRNEIRYEEDDNSTGFDRTEITQPDASEKHDKTNLDSYYSDKQKSTATEDNASGESQVKGGYTKVITTVENMEKIDTAQEDEDDYYYGLETETEVNFNEISTKTNIDGTEEKLVNNDYQITTEEYSTVKIRERNEDIPDMKPESNETDEYLYKIFTLTVSTVTVSTVAVSTVTVSTVPVSTVPFSTVSVSTETVSTATVLNENTKTDEYYNEVSTSTRKNAKEKKLPNRRDLSDANQLSTSDMRKGIEKTRKTNEYPSLITETGDYSEEFHTVSNDSAVKQNSIAGSDMINVKESFIVGSKDEINNGQEDEGYYYADLENETETGKYHNEIFNETNEDASEKNSIKDGDDFDVKELSTISIREKINRENLDGENYYDTETNEYPNEISTEMDKNAEEQNLVNDIYKNDAEGVSTEYDNPLKKNTEVDDDNYYKDLEIKTDEIHYEISTETNKEASENNSVNDVDDQFKSSTLSNKEKMNRSELDDDTYHEGLLTETDEYLDEISTKTIKDASDNYDTKEKFVDDAYYEGLESETGKFLNKISTERKKKFTEKKSVNDSVKIGAEKVFTTGMEEVQEIDYSDLKTETDKYSTEKSTFTNENPLNKNSMINGDEIDVKELPTVTIRGKFFREKVDDNYNVGFQTETNEFLSDISTKTDKDVAENIISNTNNKMDATELSTISMNKEKVDDDNHLNGIETDAETDKDKYFKIISTKTIEDTSEQNLVNDNNKFEAKQLSTLSIRKKINREKVDEDIYSEGLETKSDEYLNKISTDTNKDSAEQNVLNDNDKIDLEEVSEEKMAQQFDYRGLKIEVEEHDDEISTILNENPLNVYSMNDGDEIDEKELSTSSIRKKPNIDKVDEDNYYKSIETETGDYFDEISTVSNNDALEITSDNDELEVKELSTARTKKKIGRTELDGDDYNMSLETETEYSYKISTETNEDATENKLANSVTEISDHSLIRENAQKTYRTNGMNAEDKKLVIDDKTEIDGRKLSTIDTKKDFNETQQDNKYKEVKKNKDQFYDEMTNDGKTKDIDRFDGKQLSTVPTQERENKKLQDNEYQEDQTNTGLYYEEVTTDDITKYIDSFDDKQLSTVHTRERYSIKKQENEFEVQTNTDLYYEGVTTDGLTKNIDSFDDKQLSTVRTWERYSKKQQENEYQDVHTNTGLYYEEVTTDGITKDKDSFDDKQLSTVHTRKRYSKKQQDNEYQVQTNAELYYGEVTTNGITKDMDSVYDKKLTTVHMRERYGNTQQDSEYHKVQTNTDPYYEEVTTDNITKDIDVVNDKQLSTVRIRERYGKTQQDSEYPEVQTNTDRYSEEFTTDGKTKDIDHYDDKQLSTIRIRERYGKTQQDKKKFKDLQPKAEQYINEMITEKDGITGFNMEHLSTVAIRGQHKMESDGITVEDKYYKERPATEKYAEHDDKVAKFFAEHRSATERFGKYDNQKSNQAADYEGDLKQKTQWGSPNDMNKLITDGHTEESSSERAAKYEYVEDVKHPEPKKSTEKPDTESSKTKTYKTDILNINANQLSTVGMRERYGKTQKDNIQMNTDKYFEEITTDGITKDMNILDDKHLSTVHIRERYGKPQQDNKYQDIQTNTGIYLDYIFDAKQLSSVGIRDKYGKIKKNNEYQNDQTNKDQYLHDVSTYGKYINDFGDKQLSTVRYGNTQQDNEYQGIQTNSDLYYEEMTTDHRTKDDSFDDKQLSTVHIRERYGKTQQDNDNQEAIRNTDLFYEEVTPNVKRKDINSFDSKQLSTVRIRERYGNTQQDNEFQDILINTVQYNREMKTDGNNEDLKNFDNKLLSTVGIWEKYGKTQEEVQPKTHNNYYEIITGKDWKTEANLEHLSTVAIRRKYDMEPDGITGEDEYYKKRPTMEKDDDSNKDTRIGIHWKSGKISKNNNQKSNQAADYYGDFDLMTQWGSPEDINKLESHKKTIDRTEMYEYVEDITHPEFNKFNEMTGTEASQTISYGTEISEYYEDITKSSSYKDLLAQNEMDLEQMLSTVETRKEISNQLRHETEILEYYEEITESSPNKDLVNLDDNFIGIEQMLSTVETQEKFASPITSISDETKIIEYYEEITESSPNKDSLNIDDIPIDFEQILSTVETQKRIASPTSAMRDEIKIAEYYEETTRSSPYKDPVNVDDSLIDMEQVETHDKIASSTTTISVKTEISEFYEEITERSPIKELVSSDNFKQKESDDPSLINLKHLLSTVEKRGNIAITKPTIRDKTEISEYYEEITEKIDETSQKTSSRTELSEYFEDYTSEKQSVNSVIEDVGQKYVKKISTVDKRDKETSTTQKTNYETEDDDKLKIKPNPPIVVGSEKSKYLKEFTTSSQNFKLKTHEDSWIDLHNFFPSVKNSEKVAATNPTISDETEISEYYEDVSTINYEIKNNEIVHNEQLSKVDLRDNITEDIPSKSNGKEVSKYLEEITTINETVTDETVHLNQNIQEQEGNEPKIKFCHTLL